MAALGATSFPDVEPQGHVFRSTIGLSQAGSREQTPACVYLVSAEGPEKGYFIVYILGQEFCRLPVVQWYNSTTCSEGGQHQVMVMFKHEGHVLSYLLSFRTQELQEAFVTTDRALRHREALPATSEALSIPSATHLNPPVAHPTTSSAAHPTTSLALPAPSTPSTVSEGLINLDAEEGAEIANQPSSSALELLATLDPVVYQEPEPVPVVEPTEMIRIQYRLIQACFRAANKTLSIESIRIALMEFLPEIFPRMDQSQLGRLADEVIRSQARQQTQPRIRYSASQMFDYRDRAVAPPAYLHDLNYLPNTWQPKGTTPKSSPRISVSSPRVPPPHASSPTPVVISTTAPAQDAIDNLSQDLSKLTIGGKAATAALRFVAAEVTVSAPAPAPIAATVKGLAASRHRGTR